MNYYFILIIIIVGGCTAKVIQPFLRIEGKWKCESFEYQTEKGLFIKVDTVDFQIWFRNCNDRKDDNADWCTGEIYNEKNASRYDFRYLASFSNGDDVLNMFVDSAQIAPDRYPLEFIGRSNVYDVRYPGPNTMILSVRDEWIADSDINNSIYDVKWIFRKE